jgi:hypothetical protein
VHVFEPVDESQQMEQDEVLRAGRLAVYARPVPEVKLPCLLHRLHLRRPERRNEEDAVEALESCQPTPNGFERDFEILSQSVDREQRPHRVGVSSAARSASFSRSTSPGSIRVR